VRHRLATVVDARWFRMLDLIGTVAFSGGTLRDLLIGGDRNPPFIFKDPTYILIVLAIVVAGTAMARFLPSEAARSPRFNATMTVLDTAGVAAFTVIGAKVALTAGLAWFWVPICAALTCSGRGMLLDIVTGREPRTFQGEPYEEIAVCGGLFMYGGLLLAGQFEHSNWLITAVIVMTLIGVFAARLAVVHYGWRSWRLGSRVPAAEG
jgi:uncharacterized membrane protein YeiH